MTSIVSVWQALSPFTLVGIVVGMLGILYLAYDFIGRRSKILHRCTFVFSAGFLFAGIQLASYILMIAPRRLADGNPSLIWYSALPFSIMGLLLFIIFSSAPPQNQPLGASSVNWLNAIGSIALSGVGLVGLGAVDAPPGSSPLVALVFAIPGVFTVGLLSGFSPAIQWWMLCLPKKYITAMGAVLILCAFTLIFIQPLFGFLGTGL